MHTVFAALLASLGVVAVGDASTLARLASEAAGEAMLSPFLLPPMFAAPLASLGVVAVGDAATLARLASEAAGEAMLSPFLLPPDAEPPSADASPVFLRPSETRRIPFFSSCSCFCYPGLRFSEVEVLRGSGLRFGVSRGTFDLCLRLILSLT